MINRAKAPSIEPISSIKFPAYQKIILDNGIPLYFVDAGTQPVVKLEVVFTAGRPYESNHLVARATARLLKEGTAKQTATQLAEFSDYYGANISVPVNLDTSGLVFYSLSRHVEKLLPTWTEIITQPVFPEGELKKIVQNNKERLKIDLTKNDVLAYRQITENLFGAEHPYGYNSVESTYTNLKRDWLVDHFKEHYIAENCMLFLSGRPEKNTIELINKSLGQAIPNGKKSTPSYPSYSEGIMCEEIRNPGSPQTAIRVGRILFPRTHPDYYDFFVLNTIYGGYFGSRLMDNLREEKGYTYNVYSSLDAMHNEGVFLVGAEVSHEHKALATKEIMNEMQRLQHEKVGKDELEMVKSYLMGSFLSMVDGPFNISEIVRTAEVEQLGPEYFNRLITAVQSATPERIQQLAKQYLDPEKMSVVLVGD